MTNLENILSLQIYRLQILKNIDNCRNSKRMTNIFLDECAYCLARCALQDLISLQRQEKYKNPLIKSFCRKYKHARDFHSHLAETIDHSKVEEIFTLEEFENVLEEFCKELPGNFNAESVFDDDYTSSLMLQTIFDKRAFSIHD